MSVTALRKDIASWKGCAIQTTAPDVSGEVRGDRLGFGSVARSRISLLYAGDKHLRLARCRIREHCVQGMMKLLWKQLEVWPQSSHTAL